MGLSPSTVYWMDVTDNVCYYIKEKLKIKVAKWGTPKKYLKQMTFSELYLAIELNMIGMTEKYFCLKQPILFIPTCLLKLAKGSSNDFQKICISKHPRIPIKM
jgi:hypothetical protein